MDESFYILIMTHFSLLMSKIRVKEVKHHYHCIKLSKYNKYVFAVEENYCKSIVAVRDSMESRLADHIYSQYSHLCSCLTPIKCLAVSLQQEVHNSVKRYLINH